MRTGFIGLGAMGSHMARNLHRAGLLQRVWNRTPEKARALAAELGCEASVSPAALARDLDAIVMCVSADADVLEVVRQLAGRVPHNGIVMDCSTVASATARAAAELLAPGGVSFLDCPVSGGVEGARDATLAVMVGGDAEAFERSRPVLNALGKTV